MTAGWFSLLTFSWMNSLMTLGYARPLEASDLWKLQDHRSAGVISESILNSFDARRKKADDYNVRLANGEIKPPLRLVLKVIGDTAQVTSPLILKVGYPLCSIICSSGIYAPLSVPHHVRDQFLHCSSRRYSGTRRRKRNWPCYRPRDFAVNWLALSESLFLSGHLDWRPSSRRSHHSHLFAFSSLDDPCSSDTAQW